MACGREGLRHGAKDVGQAFVGKCLAFLDPWDSVRLRTASTQWNVPKKYGPHGELFFFLVKKEPTVLSELVEFGPCVSAETVKACALIFLHMMAEENALRSDSDSSPDLGEMWRYGCPKSPVWSSERVDGNVRMLRLLEYYDMRITSTISLCRWAELVK